MQPPAGRLATTTDLTVTPNPSGLIAPVTLTATVAVVPPAGGTPTGLVRFRAGGVVIGSATVAPSGLAAFTTGFVTPGAIDVTASYIGDTTFAPSTSDPVSHQTATAATSTLTAIVTSPSPSATGAAVTVLALVFPMGGGTPTGTVDFFDGGTPIGSGALVTFSGLQIALTTITPSTAGARTLTARYTGDATFVGSVSPPTMHTVYTGVAPSITTTALAASPASSLVGQPVTLTATVTRSAGGVAAGTVDFYAGGALLGSQTLAAGGGGAQAALTVSTLPKGLSLLTAVYRGSATSAASATLFPVFQCVDCTAANATPLAEAGPIQAVTPGAVVQLDGSASSDLEGAPLTYTWTPVTTAPFTPATLSNPNSARPTFVAAAVQTFYAFDLVVSDGTLSSPADRVFVIATGAFVNAAPIANAGPDQFADPGQGVTLSAAGSVDPDVQPAPLTYRWVLLSAPAGSTAELSDAASPTPNFYLDLEGRYELELVVFDGATLSAVDRVVVATNHPPIARAGDDQERPIGSTAYLSGVASTDEDGQRLTYQWTLLSTPAGSGAALSSPTAVRPSLTIDLAGAYTLQLIVNDGVDSSVPDFVTVSTGDLPPFMDPGPVQRATVGSTVHLSGDGASDPNPLDAATFTYNWTLVQRPAGSAAALDNPAILRPSFVADVAGDYIARLVITSGALSSEPRDVRITTGPCAPRADAGAAHATDVLEPTTLDASGSTSCNGDRLTYEWTLLSAPAGSTASLSATTPRATFVPDVAGDYVAQVIVREGPLSSVPATVLITTSAADLPLAARAGRDQAVPVLAATSLEADPGGCGNTPCASFEWRLTSRPAGSAAALTGANTPTPSFVPDAAGDYLFQLRVGNGTRISDLDTVLVTTGNAPPFSDAGPDQTVAAGSLVTLDASGSADANGTALVYEWSFTHAPGGSAAVLSNPASAAPTFVADVAGTYVAQLTVSDGVLTAQPDTVVIEVADAPTANAGPDQAVFTGAPVTLDGTGSSDPHGAGLTYAWTLSSKPAGSLASIADPSAAGTSFVPDLGGVYLACLVVHNGAVNSPSDCATITATVPPFLTLDPFTTNVEIGGTRTLTVTLSSAAGPAGVEVALAAANPSLITLPATVTVPSGATSASFDVQAGGSEGVTTIQATAAGFVAATAHVNISVSGIGITLGAGLVVAPEQVRDLSLTLSSLAPPEGVTITLTSSDPSIASVTETVYVPGGADVPVTNPQVMGHAYGMVEITATATGFWPDTQVVAVARGISLSPSTLNVVNGGANELLLQLSAPAPASGLGFTIAADVGGLVTIPASITVPANELTATIPVSGTALGSTALHVTPTDPGDTSQASATVVVSASQPLNLNGATVGRDLQAPISASLGAPAPAGGLMVTITSGDPSRALLTIDPSTAGSASIAVNVAAGVTQVPTFFVQSLTDTGSVLLTATAPGYPDATSTVSFVPSGFVLDGGNFQIGLFAINRPLSVRPMRLSPGTFAPVVAQALRGGASASVPLVSTLPAVGTITVSPVVFTGGQSIGSSAFDPLSGGATQLQLGVPPGFATPSAGQSVTAIVSSPLTFAQPTLTIGRNLQVPAFIQLGSPAPAGNLPLTITSSDPAKVLLSKNSDVAGSPSITLTVAAGSTNAPTFYVQALDEAGSVTLTASAANFTGASATVNLTPAGVVFGTGNFTTHPNATNTTLLLRTVRLEPGTLAYVPDPGCSRCQSVRGGLPVPVTVTSSDDTVGAILAVATFDPSDGSATTTFDPTGEGVATLTIVTPGAFSTPANGTQITGTVTSETATLTLTAAAVGKDLQTARTILLGQPAPAGNLLVTVTSADPSKVLLSTAPTALGSGTVSLLVPAGTSTSPTFYIQGLDESGSVDLNATAPAYFDTAAPVTLSPSGIVFATGNFSTSTLSADTAVTVRSVRLEAGTLAFVLDAGCTRCQNVRAGITADVPIVSAPTAVGTITSSPIVLSAGEGSGTTHFHPLTGGTATISIGTVAGFSAASNFTQITATVDNPALTINDTIVGRDLQTTMSVTLGAPAPPGGSTVTVTTGDPSRVLLSNTAVGAGTTSVTLDVLAGATTTPAFYVQGLTASGAAQLEATAAGYSPDTGTVSLRPSGIVLAPGDFTTGALSPNTTLTLRSAWLDPVTLNFNGTCSGCQAIRGDLTVAVTVTSSNLAVGTITGPATFNPGSGTATTQFDPSSNGTSTLDVVAPAGFSTPSNQTQITATVQPGITMNSRTIGRDLQVVVSGSLGVAAPAGNLEVTLTSADPSMLLLSTSETTVGQASIVVTVPAGSTGFQFYAQAFVPSGSVEISASAPGYSPAASTMTFAPSGFFIVTGSFTISPTAANANIVVRSAYLDGFLNVVGGGSCVACQDLRAGVSAVVPVTSSETSVGTIVGTASFTGGVGSATVQFDPIAEGTSTVALGAPPSPFSTPSNLQSIEVTVQVPPPSINLANLTVGKDLQEAVVGSLGAAAPAGNLLVTVTSADPAKVLLSNSPATPGSGTVSVTVPASSTTMPAIWIQALDSSGTVVLTASAPGYQTTESSITLWPSGFVFTTGNFIVSPTASPVGLDIRPVRLDPVFLNYTAQGQQTIRPGLPGNVLVPVTSSDPAIGTITVSPVQFAAGAANGLTAFDSAAVGIATLTLGTPAGFSTPSNRQSIVATVTNSIITVPANMNIGKDLQRAVNATLGEAAPAGNLDVTFTSSDPAKLLLSTAVNLPGSPSIVVTVPAGTSSVPVFYAQALDSAGPVQISASGTGYVSTPTDVLLRPSGFVFLPASNFTTTSFSTNTLLHVDSVWLDANLLHSGNQFCSSCQEVRAGLLVSVPVTSSDTNVGTILNSPIAFESSGSAPSALFDPVNGGTTTLTIEAPPGFSQPGNHRQITATVTAPSLTFQTMTLGKDLQQGYLITLGAAVPSGTLDLVVTSADPTKVLVSSSRTIAGADTVTLSVPAGSNNATVWVQALADTGPVQLTATATGYATGTANVTLRSSGFIFNRPGFAVGFVPVTFSTTTGAANTPLQVIAARLAAATLNYEAQQEVRAGLTVNVDVTSTDQTGTNVGTMTVSPVVFSGGDDTRTTAFDPANGGVARLDIVTPPGFSQSSNLRQLTATVIAPAITVGAVTLGKNLQQSVTVNLAEPAPAGNLDVTVTSADDTKLVLSSVRTTTGTGSVVLTIGAGQSSATVWVQALDQSGTVNFSATATGYSPATAQATLRPAGFLVVRQGFAIGTSQTFSTTTGSPNTGLTVHAVRLNSGNLAYETQQEIRGGLTVNVDVVSTDTSGTDVGAITTSPVVFTGGVFSVNTAFDPVNAGTAVITPVTPSGFSTPSNVREQTATVTAPALTLGGVTVGKDLQGTLSLSLGAPAPTGGVLVTVTSADPAQVILSTSGTTAGSGSVSFTIAAGVSAGPTIYAQALAGSGTVQLSASATGYTGATSNVSMRPSGFIVDQNLCTLCPRSFATTTGSVNVNLLIRAVSLNPATLAVESFQSLRGGHTVVVDVTATDATGTNVGTLTTSPVTFNGNDFTRPTAFDPANAGSSVIAVPTPASFSTPLTYSQITATVSAPSINMSSLTIGKDLQTTGGGTLGAPAPAGGLSITMTSADPARVLLAKTITEAGQTSISFTVTVGSTGVPTFFVHSLVGSGTTAITVSAPGYSNGSATVSHMPSGFVMTSPGANFSTTTLSPNANLQISSAYLHASTLAYQGTQALRPGVSASVDVSAVDSSGTNVGTITVSPLSFAGGEINKSTQFNPANPGSSVISVSVPAGFSTPSTNRQFTVTVTTPSISVGAVTLGKDLQVTQGGTLGVIAPTGGVAVTVTTSDPSKLLLATGKLTADETSITVNVAQGAQSIPAYYVRALAGTGSVQVNVSAPGYAPTSYTVTLVPSGFVISSPGNFTTTGGAANTTITVVSARLDAGTLAFAASQELRHGAAATVELESSNTAAGVLTLGTLTFNGGDGSKQTQFDPQPVASSTSSIIRFVAGTTPPGFTLPSTQQQITATINP